MASTNEVRLALAFLLFGSFALGCAQGGGTRLTDAGNGPGVDAGPIPLRDAGPIGRDSGPMGDSGPIADSGPFVRDSGPPPTDSGPVGCTSASECDDGIACNGVERCELGRCVAGAPPVCDDAIGCTRDRCVEPSTPGGSPSCTYVADDTLCGGGQTCNPTTGCSAGCGESPCRLVAPQCGCGAGEGCYLSATTRACAPAGSVVEGGSCASATACQPGMICLNVAESGAAVNQCARFCASDSDCVGEGSRCLYSLSDGMGGTIPGVQICSRSCNPAGSVGCSPSAGCQIYEETATGRYFTDCSAPVGTGGQGASCTSNASCRRGFVCLGTPGTCYRWCDQPGVLAGGGCSSLEACYGFTTPVVVGSTEYGVCDWAF